MSNNSKNSTSGGIGTLGVLLIVFVVLKLCGLINWSWPIVLIPLWVSLGCFVISLLVLLVVMLWNQRN